MMPETLSEASQEALRSVSTATLTTCLFKRGLRNQYLQDVVPLNPASASMVMISPARRV